MESENILNSQRNIEKENQCWGHHNARFQFVLQSCDHRDSVVLAQKQTHGSMEQNPEVDPQLYGQLIFDKGGKTTHWKKDIYMQKNETRPLSYTRHKDKLKMDERSKCETRFHQNPRGEHRQHPF